jgi:hypothetical protein
MKAAPPAGLADPAAELEALIREARRRQHRRWLAAGVAAAAVLASGGGIIAGSHAGNPRPPRGHATGTPPAHAIRPSAAPLLGPILPGAATSLVMWPVGFPAFGPNSGPAAYVDNLSTGRLSRRQIPGIVGCDCQPYLLDVGNRLVYVGSGGITAVSPDLKGKPRVLGGTEFFAPAADPHRVWLVRFLGGYLGQGPVRTWSVPINGGPAGPPLILPAGAKLLIRGTATGLLMQGRPGRIWRLALWRPGSAPENLPYAPANGISDGFDSSARLVAYGSGCQVRETAPKAGSNGYDVCQMLRVLDVMTGRLRSFGPPPGTAGWTPAGFNRVSALSPGGRLIAAYALTGSARQGRVRLYVIHIGGSFARVAAVPKSAALLSRPTVWSAVGSWLLYQGAGRHLWAYQVTSGKTRRSSTPCCQYAVMASAPNRSR